MKITFTKSTSPSSMFGWISIRDEHMDISTFSGFTLYVTRPLELAAKLRAIAAELDPEHSPIPFPSVTETKP